MCGVHFNPDDILGNLRNEVGFCTKNGFKLKPKSVPCFDPTLNHHVIVNVKAKIRIS